MKEYLISLILLVLLVGASCQKEVNIEADIAAIKELWNQYREAEISRDIDLWISLWTDDGIRMPPNNPAIYGKERIRETVQSFFDQVNNIDYTIKFTIKTE
jgi:ketosteroid isomerase-like protein